MYFRRKFLDVFFFVLVTIVILYGMIKILFYIKENCFTLISEFKITGNIKYTKKKDILDLFEKLNNLDLFIVKDIKKIKIEIEKIPWIKQAKVKQCWQNRIEINLVEYIPIGIWNNLFLIDSDGNVFKIPKRIKINYNLPKLYGPDGSEKILINWFNNIEKKMLNNNLKIKLLYLNRSYSLYLVSKDNILIKLGRDNITERLKKFVKIYPKLIKKIKDIKKNIKYVDLRYYEGLAVSFKDIN